MGHVQPPIEDYRYLKFIETFNATAISGKVGIALFGAGRAGMIHLNNLAHNSRVNLVYVVEADDERSKKVKASLGQDNIKFVNCSETDTVLADPRVHAVVITTPTQTHYPLVIESLQKGKAVFCEKPIANQMTEIKKCYDLAQELGLPLHCAFNRRFDPSFVNVRERVARGELGKVHMIKSCSRDSPLPSIDYLRTSNGIFHDCAVHDIDLVCWILNEYPTKVFASATAHMKQIAEIDDHDTVAIQLTFPSGGMSLIDLSRFAIYGYDQRLEVFGPAGMLQCGNQNALGVQSYKATAVSEAPIWYSFASRYEEAYKRELEHFINVIEGIEKLTVSSIETLSVCKVASACEESARTGKPVEIKYDF
jgi:myo-inositol 2-dehydrogenase/D-chiro-inositol 1-dehydrogenase